MLLSRGWTAMPARSYDDIHQPETSCLQRHGFSRIGVQDRDICNDFDHEATQPAIDGVTWLES